MLVSEWWCLRWGLLDWFHSFIHSFTLGGSRTLYDKHFMMTNAVFNAWGMMSAFELMDGWMDGWMDEWMDGWMDWLLFPQYSTHVPSNADFNVVSKQQVGILRRAIFTEIDITFKAKLDMEHKKQAQNLVRLISWFDFIPTDWVIDLLIGFKGIFRQSCSSTFVWYDCHISGLCHQCDCCDSIDPLWSWGVYGFQIRFWIEKWSNQRTLTTSNHSWSCRTTTVTLNGSWFPS